MNCKNLQYCFAKKHLMLSLLWYSHHSTANDIALVHFRPATSSTSHTPLMQTAPATFDNHVNGQPQVRWQVKIKVQVFHYT